MISFAESRKTRMAKKKKQDMNEKIRPPKEETAAASGKAGAAVLQESEIRYRRLPAP
jgi:hypothetical protein